MVTTPPASPPELAGGVTTHPLRLHSRILSAALVGTTVEFYDFYVFATATALVFGTLFFPKASPTAQTISAFTIFGIAFIARPMGAIAFGHYGDRVGRKSTLVVSLMLMGGSTLAIAFLPTYALIGWAAPALLSLMRFGQGFGLGGEWGGAALLAVEYAPPGWRARFASAPQLGAPIGYLMANGVFLLLGLMLAPASFLAWGWRVPFLLSAILVGLGLWVRLRIAETPAFRAAMAREAPHAVPLAPLFRHHWRALLAGTAGVVSAFAGFYMATAYALSQGTTALHYSRQHLLGIQLGADLFLAGGIIVAAILADRVGAGKVMLYGAVACGLAGVGFGFGLGSGSMPLVFATLALTLFTMGLVYGPLSAWLPTLFPVAVRYSGISLAFSTGGIVGGAVMPLVARMMADAGHAQWVGLLLTGAAVVTALGVLTARPASET